MYVLRSKSVNYVSAYPLRIRVSTSHYTLIIPRGGLVDSVWSSPLRIYVSANPLHDQTTLRLFLGKGGLRHFVSTVYSITLPSRSRHQQNISPTSEERFRFREFVSKHGHGHGHWNAPHDDIFFLCDVITFSYYVMFIHNVRIFKRKA